jgi:hypothetical protein
MQDDSNQLTDRARQWIGAIREQFAGVPLQAAEAAERPRDALAFKTAT